MYSDRKILHTVTVLTLVILLLALFIPGDFSGRFVSAALLLPISVLTYFFIKKRSTPSINRKEILLILSVFAAVYLIVYYLTGLTFGFYSNIYIFSFKNFLSFIVPISIIIVSTEVVRFVVRAQNSKLCDALCYISSVIAEVLVYGNIHYVDSFNRFMEFMGINLFPAIIANLLYHYISKRYGMLPNVVYRLVTTLYLYILPIIPAMSDSLFAVYELVFPILIYLFVDSLYEKKKRYALVKKSKLALPLTVVSIAILISFVMLISNQFRFGTLVIATDSMTGEINKGDAVLYERYDDQIIEVGQVIVFKDDDSKIVHRVVDIEMINGVKRYYTKGDANDENDSGFRIDADIVGLVDFKVPYVGYPTLLMRAIFSS